MKIRSLITSTLLAAGLGLGITAPAQAHDSSFSLWRLYDYGHYPRIYHGWYSGDRRHHRHFREHSNWYHWRDHDDDRHDRGRDHDGYDGHDGHRGH